MHRPGVGRARDLAQLANARVDLRRYTTLAAQDSIATLQLDTPRALIAQAAATVQNDQAQIAYARVQLTQRDCRADRRAHRRAPARLRDARRPGGEPGAELVSHPVGYLYLDRLSDWMRRRRGAPQGTTETA